MTILDNSQYLNKLENVIGMKRAVAPNTTSVYIAYKNAVNNIIPRLLVYKRSLPVHRYDNRYKRNVELLIPTLEQKLDKVSTVNKFQELVDSPIEEIFFNLFKTTLPRFLRS